MDLEMFMHSQDKGVWMATFNGHTKVICFKDDIGMWMMVPVFYVLCWFMKIDHICSLNVTSVREYGTIYNFLG